MHTNLIRLHVKNVRSLEEALSRIADLWLLSDEQFQLFNFYKIDLEVTIVYALKSFLRYLK